MKPYFIKSSINSVKYRGDTVNNNPINLSLCKSISKSNFAWYPDNFGLNAISFNMIDTEEPVKWVYRTKEERDLDFDKISNNEI